MNCIIDENIYITDNYILNYNFVYFFPILEKYLMKSVNRNCLGTIKQNKN